MFYRLDHKLYAGIIIIYEISKYYTKTGQEIPPPCQRPHFYAIIINCEIKIKGGEIVVELDQFKVTLNSYAEPLVEVRDSL